MSALERAYLPIAALSLGLSLSCAGDSSSQCPSSLPSSQCMSSNIMVLTPRICSTQDWALKVKFINDPGTFQAITATLRQSPGTFALPIVLKRDPADSSFNAVVKKATLPQKMTGVSTFLEVDKEPSYGKAPISINSLFSLTRTTKDYVDPGTTEMDGTASPGTFPWPERVGVRTDGSIVVLNEGVELTTLATAWKILNLRYDSTNELAIKPAFFFNFTNSYTTASYPFSVEVNANNLLVISDLQMKAANLLSCTGTESSTAGCVGLCNPAMAGTSFASLLHRDYKSLFVHPQAPWIAYADAQGNLLTAGLPDRTTMNKIAWASPVSPPQPGPAQVLLGMGNLSTTDQPVPSLLAAYQSTSAVTPVAYLFNSSLDGSLVPDMPTTKALGSPELLGTKPIQGLVIGDLDGDKLDDIVFVRDGKVQVLNNLGGGSYCPDVLADAPAEVTGLAVGDINADGRKDVVLISKLAKAVTAYLNK